MTSLDRRDRRRASKVWEEIRLAGYVWTTSPGARAIIAAALKREREEAQSAWVLFDGGAAERAMKAKKRKRS